MAGSFGYEMNLGRLSDGEKQMMKEQICMYKERQPLIHDGLYYRLTNPMQGDMAAWEWHDPKSGQVLVQGGVLLELDREGDVGFELFFIRKERHGNQRKDVKEI